jgi:UDPglucose 6-dehydrogenase/GDP-mannose 6-dehydrogenase
MGGMDEKSLAVQEELYSVFPGIEVVKTNNKTAELIKYTSNALLATLISFSNEIANLGAAVGGIDAVDVMRGLHLSKYLSTVLSEGQRVTAPITSFLWAGCGFGGSCLPKDLKALSAHGARFGSPTPLLNAVLEINAQQHRQVLYGLKKHFSSLKGVRVAVLGLAFRPDTDDIRESPAIPIVRDLLAAGAEIRAHDPVAIPNARRIFEKDRIALYEDMDSAINDADAIVIVTRWDEFRRLPKLLQNREPQPLVFDGRRMLDKHSISRYAAIGL